MDENMVNIILQKVFCESLSLIFIFLQVIDKHSFKMNKHTRRNFCKSIHILRCNLTG